MREAIKETSYFSFRRMFDKCFYIGIGFGFDEGKPQCLIISLGFYGLVIGPHLWTNQD